MRKKRSLVFIFFLFTFPLFGDYYYNFGKRIDLIPIQKSFRNAIKGYQTRDGKELYLQNNQIILKPKKSAINDLIKRYNLELIKEYDGSIFLVETDKNAITLSNELFEKEEVEFATPNFEIPKRSRELDPLYPQQWYLTPNFNFFSSLQLTLDAGIKIEDAWKYAKGKGVKIAIIDDGFDINHPEIKDAIIYAYSIDRKSSDVSHINYNGYHGTACSGIVGARENEIGIKGVAPESKLIVIQLVSDLISDTLEAFDKAVSAGAQVISNSWGTYQVSEPVANKIDYLSKYARSGKGIVIIFAAGNDNKDINGDESALNSVIGVGSTDSKNKRAWYSNYGEELDIVAPGGDGSYINIATIDDLGDRGLIKSSSTHPDYIYYNNSFAGTSASAPIVAGVVALLLEINPNFTRDEIYDIITQTADKIGTTPYQDGKNIYYGYGKINAKNAINRAIELTKTTKSMSLEIKEGWNLISLPRGESVDVKYYFNDAQRVWLYRSDKWYTYPILSGYNELSLILKNEGFWVKSDKNLQKEFYGDIFEFESKDINGWQLLGTQKRLTNPKERYGFLTVFKYLNGTWIQNPSTIEPGEGFWAKK